MTQFLRAMFKRKTLYNQHFPTFAHFKAAVDGFFANIASYRDESTA